MDAKFTGPGTSTEISFGDVVSPSAQPPAGSATGAKFNPGADGKLPIALWGANKGVESHWVSGLFAHLRADEGHQVTEAEFDAALAQVKGLRLG